MTSIRHWAGGIAAALVAAMAATTAGAETKLTGFNGEWRGNGSERNFPLESMQPTNCHTAIRATLRRMHSEMTCERPSGLRKEIRLIVTLEGDKFAGRIRQITTPPDGKPAVLNGTVSGQKTDNTASFQVRWSGMTPNATVALKLNNPSSFSMQASSLGVTMMDATLNRTAAR
jgi:hypothetical protein